MSVLCLLGVCWLGVAWFWPRQRLNLLLVTLDTTRADRLGCYGYAAGQTPALDALAARGVLFENSYTVVPLTLPSHATMFTGMTPREHGLHENGTGKLSVDLPVLAEILRAQGYETGAFVASYVLNAKFGLDRGFDIYDDDLSGGGYADHDLHRRRDGQLVVDNALEWLGRRNSKPFFCWVHLFDAHAPYKPRESLFQQRFQDQPYDAGIAYVDLQVQRIMEHLTARGLDRDTLIVVVGDHGEGLGEHAEREHGHMLYNSTLHVPLIIAQPQLAQPGHRVSAAVSLTDLFPTLVDCLGIKSSSSQAARSVRSALLAGSFEPRACFAETDAPIAAHGAAAQRSVIIDSWKYIRSPRPELYDLGSNRGETRNLIDSEPARKQELDAQISAWEASSIPHGSSDVRLSPAEQRRLNSLGYAGHNKVPSDASGRELPDIKDRIACYNSLMDASELLHTGHAQAAVTAAEKLLNSTPDYLPARVFLGEALRSAGRPADAERVFRSILKSEHAGTSAELKLGVVLAQQEKYADALDQFRKFLQSDPESAECHLQMGIALKGLKRYPDAQQEMELALRLDPESPSVHYEVGVLLASLGRAEQSLAEYQAALRYAPDWAAPHSEMAVTLGQQNRLPEALQHARQAVQLEPQNADYQYNLGIMHVAQGELAAAIGPLSEALRLRPDHPHAAEQLQRVRAALNREK